MSTAPESPSRERVVLVVDDDPQVLGAVRRCFRDDSFEVITAGGSDEALAWASEVPVGLVIADQIMPGMSGTELIGAIRAKHPGTPCAILTGYSDPAIVREASKVQAPIIFKPWSDQLLRETALRLLAPEAAGPKDGGSDGRDEE